MDFCTFRCYNYNVCQVECGIPPVLGHTFCTKCITSGMDVNSAQYLMGHSDAGTTLNIYTDVSLDKVYESMELLEKRCKQPAVVLSSVGVKK